MLFWLYMLIGLIYGVYDWKINHEEAYNKAIKTGNIEFGMIPIYWILMFLCWPLMMCINIYINFTKNKK